MSQDPERGCGTKSTNACYGESPVRSPAGLLGNWTWLLSDGYANFIPVTIPARKMIVFNPAATIVTQTLERMMDPDLGSIALQDVYNKMLDKTRYIGIADHVGSDYSAFSFAMESRDVGVSRRMSRQTAHEIATVIWQHGSVPIMFSHNRIPVFDDKEHCEEAFRIVDACYDTVDLSTMEMTWTPTWEEEDWSMYRRGKSKRTIRHFMKPILNTVGRLDKEWRKHSKIEAYQNARSFFKDVRFVEQAFGLAWLGRLTLTADDDGAWDEEAMDMQVRFGQEIINTIDLNQLDSTPG